MKSTVNYKTKAGACARIGDTCARSLDYSAALVWYERACLYYEKHAGAEHPYVAATHSQIGRVHACMGAYPLALFSYSRAYEIQRHAFGESHPETLGTLTYLADTYRQIRDFSSAISLFTKIALIQERMPPPLSMEAAVTCNDLALTHWSAGDKDAALRWLNHALELCAPETIHYALTACNLAELFYEKNDVKSSLEWYEKAYGAYAAAEYMAHAAGAASGVAKAYGKIGNFEEALSWSERALKLNHSFYGDLSERTAASHNNTAIYCHKRGELKKALDHYERALAIHKCVFGEAHILTVRSYGNIAAVHESMGEHERAVNLYQEALSLITDLPHEKSEEASLYNNIAVSYHRHGNYDEAIAWYQRSAKLSGDDISSAATALSNIGGVCLALKRYVEAEEYFVKAYSIFLEALGNDHPDTAFCCLNLGLVYVRKDEQEKAVEWYERAQKHIISAFGPDHEQAIQVEKMLLAAHEALCGQRSSHIHEKIPEADAKLGQ